MLELSHNQTRQYIDAVAVFEAWEEATREAQQVRGGMYWHKGPLSKPDAAYLVRTSPAGSETSLGPRSPATEDVYARFQQRKAASAERLSTLQAKLVEHTRMNRALRVGRLDPLVVSILDRLLVSGLAGYFRVVGTHALYAYEAAAGVRVEDGAVATRDIDLLWDVRQRIRFATQLARVDSSVLGLLQKVDKSFRLRTLRKYTAVNQDGFEVDILRREQLMDALPFSAVVVASNGKMARMHTLHPTAFAQFKRWLGGLADRDPLKRRRDVLQADVVEHLVKGYLPPV